MGRARSLNVGDIVIACGGLDVRSGAFSEIGAVGFDAGRQREGRGRRGIYAMIFKGRSANVDGWERVAARGYAV